MDRRLVVTGVIGILLIGTLVIILAVVTTKSCDRSPKATCSTTECVHAASLLLESMNRTVEPCDDFYEFACGGFEKSTSIPDDEAKIGVFTMVNNKLREQLRLSIENPSGPGELKPFRLAKDLYRTCMNESAIEEAGFGPLSTILRELGGWPVLEENWEGDTFDWIETFKKCWKLGYSQTVQITDTNAVETDSTNRLLPNVQLNQFKPSLPRDYLVEGSKNEIVRAYFDFMVGIAVMLGANKQRAVQELQESLEFETKLANVSWFEEVQKKLDLLNDTLTRSELNRQYPSVDSESDLNGKSPPTVPVDAYDIVDSLEFHYVRNFGEITKNTTKRTLANYLVWRVVQDSVKYLTKDLRAREMEYRTVFDGRKEREARWKECVDIVMESLPISIGALYVRNHFKEDAKEKTDNILNDIRTGFVEILEQAEWMDEKTRTNAMEKVASMGSHIAYPDELRDDKKLEEYYASLELTDDNLLATVLNLTVFETKLFWKHRLNPSKQTDWIVNGRAAIVNAFYNRLQNSIQIPACILQGDIFSNDRPQYMNYGAIGFVVGHEITHGFDDVGSQYDKDGKFVDWWTPETKAKYLKKTKCMVHQYESYTAKSVGLNLNGIKTLAENIADNGGAKAAYFAYKNWVKRNGPEPRLPGLDYTPEQMFWVSAANLWCTKIRPKELKVDIATDDHSPRRFRVIGPFSNSPEFSADFNCPSGSAMNPIDKCSVW